MSKWKPLLLVPFFIFCGTRNDPPGNINNNFQDDKTLPIPSDKKFAAFYKWKENYDPSSTLLSRIKTPEGYRRLADSSNAYGLWLRNIPLKPAGTPVKLYNGTEKSSQAVHFAVVDIDCGTKDLQQCADAVMRLRAEFLYGNNLISDIHFRYTSGDNIPFSKWKEGWRPVVKGNKVSWSKSQSPSAGYQDFKSYLWNIFNYAGSKSLSSEMKKVERFADIRSGDVLIIGGFPGHAMTVMDVAVNPENGKKIFLLSQSYMPAQDIHIVKNPVNEKLSPWYEIPEGAIIETPEWTFKKENLMRW